ncbi:response regulator [Flavobacterium sp. J49]|uniref:response regulator n=1 Tax=Flavobacterium sp. J49 TaxID=2718534 RepID=UPI00159379DF|nr:response regulator [Flavobacterium sp. J49]MBF6641081.1 response regulator [Flavobacterium sp. J49]NIC02328.1 response regulator [Flavobacterium sp. J49]
MKFNNVFVVDDDKVHHFIIKKLLEKNNIQVNATFFENGDEALKDLKSKLLKGENPPDLILLDINMPVLDGWQFLEEFNLLKEDFPEEITICLVSSSEDYFNTDMIELFKNSIANYYVKPMTNDMVKSIFLE